MLRLLGLYSPMKVELMTCILALLFALSLACEGSGNIHEPAQDVATATPSPMSTDGPIWVAKRLNGKPVIAIWGPVLRLYTYENGAGGFDGCNHFAGGHEDGSHVAHPDGSISLPGLAGTLAGCPFPRILMERQSESYLVALADAKRYQILGNRLEIRDGSGKLRMVMVNKSPLVGAAEDLTGTAWRLVSNDGKAPRGTPPTLAFWDEAFVGGTVADYGFVAQYDKWRTSYRIRSRAVTGAETSRLSRIPDREVRDFLQGIGSYGGHAVREEGGIRLLRIRTDQGYALDFEELMPAVDSISDAEWRLKSFVEVRRDEYRYGRPPCVENVLPGSDIVARFTETTVVSTVGPREYSLDDLSLSMVRPGESMPDGLAGLDRWGSGLLDGECPREDGEKTSEWNAAMQGERYLELLPQLRRYMIFGDRLVILTDSHQVLLFQAEKVGWLNALEWRGNAGRIKGNHRKNLRSRSSSTGGPLMFKVAFLLAGVLAIAGCVTEPPPATPTATIPPHDGRPRSYACAHRYDSSNDDRPGTDACAHLDRLAQATDGRPQNRRTEGVVPGFGRGRSNPRIFDGRP